jgi:hypothetical protein
VHLVILISSNGRQIREFTLPGAGVCRFQADRSAFRREDGRGQGEIRVCPVARGKLEQGRRHSDVGEGGVAGVERPGLAA